MYEKVSTNMNFVEREKNIEKFWADNHIFEKSVDSRKEGETYTFYDGPPTANGKPHIGHVPVSYTHLDVYKRQTMPNKHYAELKNSYLFYNIAQKVKKYQEEHPGAKMYRMGIGDVSLPLGAAVIEMCIRDRTATAALGGIEDMKEEAEAIRDGILAKMEALRAACDEAETITAKEY